MPLASSPIITTAAVNPLVSKLLKQFVTPTDFVQNTCTYEIPILSQIVTKRLLRSCDGTNLHKIRRLEFSGVVVFVKKLQKFVTAVFQYVSIQ